MADVLANLYDWSTTAGSNFPQGATTVGTGVDDNFGQVQATVRAWLANKGADIASATTTDLGAVAGLFHDITGTTTITGFGTVAAGIWKVLKFEGALTLTHNATSLILPGGANITTANGDMLMATSEGGGNWRVNWFVKASAAVTSALLTMSTARLLGRTTASTGAIEEISVGATLTLSGGTLSGTAASTTQSGVSELATSTEVRTGSDTTRTITPDALLTALGFSSVYESPGQTITAGGSLTLAHGHGRVPEQWALYLVCTSGEAGFSTNDVLLLGHQSYHEAGPVSYGATVVPDATNLNIRFGAASTTFTALRKDTGVIASLTNANWTAVFKSWA